MPPRTMDDSCPVLRKCSFSSRAVCPLHRVADEFLFGCGQVIATEQGICKAGNSCGDRPAAICVFNEILQMGVFVSFWTKSSSFSSHRIIPIQVRNNSSVDSMNSGCICSILIFYIQHFDFQQIFCVQPKRVFDVVPIQQNSDQTETAKCLPLSRPRAPAARYPFNVNPL